MSSRLLGILVSYALFGGALTLAGFYLGEGVTRRHFERRAVRVSGDGPGQIINLHGYTCTSDPE